MADKKLNELQSVTNCTSIYAESSNGNQVKISKESLAYVLGGIYNHGNISVDFNDYKETGLFTYETSSNADNAPSNESCLVLVISNSTYCVQVAFSLTTTNIYVRRALLYIGTWYNWRTL